MKSQPELIEGPEAARRFSAAIVKILSVSHEELIWREEEYQKQGKKNPHRCGPKPKK